MKLFMVLLFSLSIFAEIIPLSNGSSANLSFSSYPVIYKLEIMKISFDREVENFKVKLYHPGINHYSSDPVISKSLEESNTYILDNVFFILDGEWELQIVDSDNQIIGTSYFDIKKYSPERKVTTHAIFRGQTYQGQEFYNGKSTGQTCYVIIDSVNENAKGKHCYDVSWRYASNRIDVPKEVLTVSSRVTNYHRSEYPKIKTCAMNVSGYTSGDDIYENDTEFLVNDIFNGMIKNNKTEYHHFLSIGKEDKQLYQARVHGLRWYKEWDVDCKNLKEVK